MTNPIFGAAFANLCRYPSIRQAFLMFLYVFIALTSISAQAQELLVNQGFEGTIQTATAGCGVIPGQTVSGTIGQNWVDNSCAAGTITYLVDTSTFRSGTQSQKVTITGGTQAVFHQNLPFGESIHSGTVWLKTASASSMSVNFALRQTGSPYYYYGYISCSVTTSWTPCTISGLTGATSGVFQIILNTASSSTPVTLWVDDTSLTSYLPVLPTTAVTPQYFGMHIHRSGMTTDPLPNPWTLSVTGTGLPRNPISAIRLWGADKAGWIDVCRNGPCPAISPWDWTGLDAHVNRALVNGATELILTLGGATPTWASTRSTECSPWSPNQRDSNGNIIVYGTGGHTAVPNNQAWIDWVTALGNRYKGKIKYWQIWNEPTFDAPINGQNAECGKFYTGTAGQLVALADTARTILKGIDPTNQILSPSGVTIPALKEYLDAGGANFADIMSYHFYMQCDSNPDPGAPVLTTTPERVYRGDIAFARKLIGSTKPIWNTEVGRVCNTDLSDQTAAAYLARSLVLNHAGGIDRHYFYAWDQGQAAPNVGGTRLYVTNPTTVGTTQPFAALTPAGIAYREVAKWLIGNKVIQVTAPAVDLANPSSDNWVIKLQDSKGRFSYIVWNPIATGSVTVQSDVVRTQDSASFVPLKRTIDGQVSKVSIGESIATGASPIMISSGILIDNLAANVSGNVNGSNTVSFTGFWCTSVVTNYFGTPSLYNRRGVSGDCGSGAATAATYRWTPNVPAAGAYDVYVWWSANSVRSTSVPFSVVHSAGAKTNLYNEQQGGGKWVLHGRYTFAAGMAGYAEVVGNTTANGQAGADAVLLLPTP